MTDTALDIVIEQIGSRTDAERVLDALDEAHYAVFSTDNISNIKTETRRQDRARILAIVDEVRDEGLRRSWTQSWSYTNAGICDELRRRIEASDEG